MRRTSFAYGCAVALVALTATTAEAQLQNGSFESPNIPTSPGYVYFSGLVGSWNFFAGAGVVNTSAGPTAFNAPSATDGSQIAFVQGYGSFVEQSLPTLLAGTYQLGFHTVGRQITGNYDGTTSYGVYLGANLLLAGATTSNDNWVQYTLTVPTTGAAVLRFQNESAAGDHTFFLDDVTLTNDLSADAIAVAPEPASLILLATGMFGVAGFARRKRAA
jgi:hypothetical protein